MCMNFGHGAAAGDERAEPGTHLKERVRALSPGRADGRDRAQSAPEMDVGVKRTRREQQGCLRQNKQRAISHRASRVKWK